MPDDLTARLAALLGEHRLTTPVQCLCGWRETDPRAGSHAAHVAAVLAEAGVGFVADVERVTPEEIKDQRDKGWPDFHPEDYCHRCGERNLVWFADSEAWNVATAAWSAKTGRDGICCPRCFAEMHEAATGKCTTWHLTADEANLRSRVQSFLDERRFWNRPEDIAADLRAALDDGSTP